MFGASFCLVLLIPFILESKARATSRVENDDGNAVAAEQTRIARTGRVDHIQTEDGYADNDVVHIVFSTDCSGYQHWQSIALWYAAQSAGHPGPVTRIASGCSKGEDRRRIAAEWSQIDGGKNQFRVHFTPNMQLEGSYKYSNKPGGIKHWLQNAKIDEKYIVLLDPDMMPLLPITTRLGLGLDPIPKKTGCKAAGIC